MIEKMNSPQLPSSEEDIEQISPREVEWYQMKKRGPIYSKLDSEAVHPLTKRISNDEINYDFENSPESSIEFLGYKKRSGCQIQKEIQNPLRKILHCRDRCTILNIQANSIGNETYSDKQGSLNQSFFANLLEKNNTVHTKINQQVQNRESTESKVRNIEDLFEDVFLIEIQKNPLCNLMQRGKKERDRSYEQSQSQQASMGIRLNNQNIQIVRQNVSPNYPQTEDNILKQTIQLPNYQEPRALRSTTRTRKKQERYEKRMKNIQRTYESEDILQINSENEIQVTNLKSLEISSNMLRKQNNQVQNLIKQCKSNNSEAGKDKVIKENSKTKKIKRNQASWNLSDRDQQLFQEFQEVIRITKDRNLPCGQKDYRWKLGTINIWRDINTALQINFSTFLRKSKKYQSIFKKYIPRRLHFKIEFEESKKKQETENMLLIPSTKLQSRRDRKKKQQIKNLMKIRQLFNKAQLARLIDYERMIDEKGRPQALVELSQSQYSDYEPEQTVLENMIEDIVVMTNKKQRRGSKIQVNGIQRRQLQAKNQLLIHNLTKASRDYNFINNLASIFNFYRQVPSLSCLEGGSLGLRSNNCRIIDQSTFLLELKEIQIRESVTTIPESNSLNLIKFERPSNSLAAN